MVGAAVAVGAANRPREVSVAAIPTATTRVSLGSIPILSRESHGPVMKPAHPARLDGFSLSQNCGGHSDLADGSASRLRVSPGFSPGSPITFRWAHPTALEPPQAPRLRYA